MPGVMPKRRFLALIQKFAAVQAVGPSAVRGQPKGTLKKIHAYLGRLRLDRLAGMDRTDYARWLGAHTQYLRRKLGGRKEQWGVARKAMNLFARQCLYNTYLSRAFHLAWLQRHMETPLDSVVARGLKKEAEEAGRAMPSRWKGLVGLDSKASEEFQDEARKCARDVGVRCRVFLDNYLWLKYR